MCLLIQPFGFALRFPSSILLPMLVTAAFAADLTFYCCFAALSAETKRYSFCTELFLLLSLIGFTLWCLVPGSVALSLGFQSFFDCLLRNSWLSEFWLWLL